MSCWLENKCKKLHCNDENGCLIKFKLDYLYDAAYISEDQRKYIALHTDEDGTDFEEFKRLKNIQDNIVDFVNKGSQLYLHSNNSGNGKTSWALRLVQAYLASTWLTSPLECKVLYINLPTFFNAFKETFTANPGKDAVDYVQHILNNYKKCDIIIWDDVATKQFSKFEGDELLGLLDGRAKKCNIFTSNLKDSELHQAIGDRLYSRIANGSINIELHGSDKRGLY